MQSVGRCLLFLSATFRLPEHLCKWNCAPCAGLASLSILWRDIDLPVVVHVSCLPPTLEAGCLAQTGLQSSNSLCSIECILGLLVLLSLSTKFRDDRLRKCRCPPLSIHSTGDGAQDFMCAGQALRQPSSLPRSYASFSLALCSHGGACRLSCP